MDPKPTQSISENSSSKPSVYHCLAHLQIHKLIYNNLQKRGAKIGRNLRIALADSTKDFLNKQKEHNNILEDPTNSLEKSKSTLDQKESNRLTI